MKEVMVLISVKLKRSSKFKDVNMCLEKGAVKIVDLINKWAYKSEIDAIIGFDGDTIRQEFEDTIDYWMYPLRVIRKVVKRVQVYFKVQTNNTVKELVEKELQYCKDNNISITTKTTGLEYI